MVFQRVGNVLEVSIKPPHPDRTLHIYRPLPIDVTPPNGSTKSSRGNIIVLFLVKNWDKILGST